MRIRQRLTISFTTTVMLIIIFFGMAIYYFSSRYRKNEFYGRMLERVEITEKMFLERNNLPAETYELIREQFLNKLPNETEEVYSLDNGVDSLRLKYPPDFVSALVTDDLGYFEADDIQGVGKVFHLSGGDYAVILTAEDLIGVKMLDYLQKILIVSIVACVIAVILVSVLISSSVISPITRKIQKANAISAKNIHERLTVYDPDDELGELAIAFNNLLDRMTSVFDAQRSFIHDASHEMRNPLTAIIGEAELALDKDRSKEEYIESFRSIAAEGNRLNFLVNNLFEMARVEEGSSSLKSEIMDIRSVLVEAKKKFDFGCPENLVRLPFNGMPYDKDILVQGNNHLLETAFINVFDNASKFSSNQEVTVGLEQLGEQVVVSIQDQGVGIPADELPKVSRPFHRANNVRHMPGSGIGIPLAMKIVELHRGTLEIESTLNVGTKVSISLPLLRKANF